MTRRYYLGQPVEVPKGDLGGWVDGVVFADDRRRRPWRMWGPQLAATPWGEP